MKRFLLIFVFVLTGFTVLAQDWPEASAELSATVLARLDASSDAAGHLSCDFVQTRHTALLEEDMVSRGHMVLDAPKFLVWEYVSPSAKSYSMNLTDNRKYQAMGRKKDFSRVVFDGPKQWKIVLTPLKRDLRQLFRGIEVWMDKQSGEFVKVTMTDPSGDYTTIQFSNVKR